ncbi:MAG: holo-ACP synthase [Anaerolineae bacterium]
MKAIGVDIIETQRIADLLARRGDRFLNRVYTPREVAYCRGNVPSLAARWAAKEAMSKAFGTGIGDMAFKEIEVTCNRRGQPKIVLHGQAKLLAERLGFERIALSLAHTRQYAVAFVAVD